jgi:hypothetical protein
MNHFQTSKREMLGKRFDVELIAEYAAPNGANPTPAGPVREYAYCAGEMLIQADASDCKWLVSDHLGSPRIILGKSGSLADTRRRDLMPFGEGPGRRTIRQNDGAGVRAVRDAVKPTGEVRVRHLPDAPKMIP